MNAPLNANPTRKSSNETQGHINQHVSALDPLLRISLGGRHRPREGDGRRLRPVGVLILVIWLYGTLVLGERRSAYVIMLLGSISGLGVLVIHMRGAGLVGGRIANSSGVFFWVWTLLV